MKLMALSLYMHCTIDLIFRNLSFILQTNYFFLFFILSKNVFCGPTHSELNIKSFLCDQLVSTDYNCYISYMYII